MWTNDFCKVQFQSDSSKNKIDKPPLRYNFYNAALQLRKSSNSFTLILSFILFTIQM